MNCAAWTAVDLAEEREEAAFAVNARGAAALARACHDQEGIRLVHISTDYVFDGAASSPYVETETLSPKSAYGRTKAAGEWAVRAELPDRALIVRTGWLYGAAGGCFPKTIARVAEQNGSVAVVADQVGQPTWTYDVCAFVQRLVDADAPPGAYHATSSGRASWHEFAVEVCKSAGLEDGVVTATTSEDFKRPAPRPGYSVLGHAGATAVGVPPIDDWRTRWKAAADSVLGLNEGSGRRAG
jgi:dTDP-4-dehydrorhamnose reductase